MSPPPQLIKAIERTWRRRPRFSRLVFMNGEFRDSPEGMAASCDLFAVVALPLMKPRRHPLDMDADTFQMLNVAVREELSKRGRNEITLDLIIRGPGRVTAYWTLDPLLRVSGEDRSFRQRHLRYVEEESLLGKVA
jgi:hypothetical protein